MIDRHWAAHEHQIHRAGGWLILLAIGVLLVPTNFGAPATLVLVAAAVLFLTGGVMCTHVPYVPEPDDDEPMVLDDRERERYVVPDRLWSKP